MAGHGVPERYWRGGKCAGGVEYFHEPSRFAQDFWIYPILIGQARVPTNHRHQHEHEDRCLIHYVRRGEMWHRFRNQTHQGRAGQVVLMDMSEPVTYGTDASTTAVIWWVCFGGKDLPHLFARLGADQEPVFRLSDTQRFETLFRELLALFRAKPPAFEARADGVTRLLLAELLASRAEEAGLEIDLVKLARPIGLLSQPVRDVIRYVARFYNAAQILTFKKLCSVSGLSKFHFARLFRRETGMSAMKYLDAYRIEKAKQVLESSNQPMTRVAAMAGVPSPTKFSRLFHKLTGVTPTQFRERAQRRTRKS